MQKRKEHIKPEPFETDELCHYGCGKQAKFKNQHGTLMCGKGAASCDVNKRKNASGLVKAHDRAREKHPEGKAGLYDYDSLPQETKDKMNCRKDVQIIPNEEIFIEYSPYSNGLVRKRIEQDNLMEHKCACCGITEWQGKEIVLDLDHINGNNQDNRLENLRFLCPNCHSQTSTFRGRNKNTGTVKITDEELLISFKECGTIRKALMNVGLAAKGGNYNRMKLLIAKNNL